MRAFLNLTSIGCSRNQEHRLRETCAIERLLRTAEGHEDGGDGEDQADDHTPAPKEEDPALFQQAPQVEVAPKKGVEQEIEPTHQQQ